MLQGWWKGLKDLFYPNCCIICKKRLLNTDQEQFLCVGCWEKIEKNLPPFCSGCGRHLDSAAIKKQACPDCSKSGESFYFDHAFSPCIYTGSVKKLIREFKYSGKKYLGKPLGKLMNEFIRDYRLPIEHLDFIIPVPLHKSRLRQREFNQAEILSRQIAGEFSKTVLTDNLIRTKPTRTQTELTFAQRCQNMEQSFAVTQPEIFKAANLLLVDDVLTSGATATQAAKCLKAAGAQKVLLLTLAC